MNHPGADESRRHRKGDDSVATTTHIDEDAMNGTIPIWVKILFRYGIVGALCLLFAYVLVSDLHDGQKELAKGQKQITEYIAVHQQQMKMDNQSARIYLHAICIAVAVQAGTPKESCPSVPAER